MAVFFPSEKYSEPREIPCALIENRKRALSKNKLFS